MQHSLNIEPLPQFASHQADSSFGAQASSSGQPLCGAFDALTGFLLLGCSSGAVSCLHLGRYGSTARRVLGRHAGRVTAACLFPWQAPEHIAAAATVVPCARTASFFATCSADATIKMWTSDPKALHTTDACLQTLRGHRAAVTSLAAVQVAHTRCLLSGSSDGQVLLWRAEAPADSGDQQLSGAAMLAQLVPHMRLTESPLYTSPHWVLGITCPLQHTDAGVEQGAFIVLAQQPLLQVPINRSAVADTAAGMAASAAAIGQQHYRGSTPSSSRPILGQQHGSLPPSRLSIDTTAPPAQQHSKLAPAAGATGSSLHSYKQCSSAAVGAACGTALKTACSSPTSTAQRLQRLGSGNSIDSSSYISSYTCSPGAAAAAAPVSVSEVPGTQRLSIFAVKFVLQQMAVLTLAYDGACWLHSVVEGVTRCCWRSPTSSCYMAVDVCTGPQGQVVLLGDDKGSLHLYSLTSEKLLATKQVAQSRIAAIISCDTTAASLSGSSSSSGGARASRASSSGSNRDGTCVQFAVLCEERVGLWQLRQGFNHGIVPAGHRQGMLVLQYCASKPQVQPSLSLAQQPTAPTLSKSDSLSSFFASTLQHQPDTTAPHDTGCSNGGGGCGSSGGGCGSNGDPLGIKESSQAGSSSSGGCGSNCQPDSSVGPMLLSAGLDGRVIQWDVSGSCPTVVQSVVAAAAGDGRPELTAIAYLQEASVLATGHDNGQILLWRMDTGSHTVLGPQAHTNSVSCMTTVTSVKGDEQLVSAGFDGWVCLWEPRQVRGIKPHLIVRFQANGPRSGSPRLLQSQQQQQHGQKPTSASSSRPTPGSRATSAQQGWPVGDEQYIHTGTQQQQQQHRLKSPPVSASARPGSDTNPSSRVSSSKPQPAGSAAHCSSTDTAEHSSRANSRGSNADSVGGWFGSSSPVDVLTAIKQVPPEVLVVLFEPFNQVIITGGNDGLVKVWAAAASGVLLGQHVGHTAPVNCLALDGNLLFSGSHNGEIRAWDVLPPWFTGKGDSTSVRALSPTAAAGTPAAASHMQAVSHSRLGNTADSSVAAAGAGAGRTRSACRSPGGGSSSSSRRTVATSSAFTVLKGHTGSIAGLAVASESGVLVSCGADGQVLQWNYCTGQLLGRYSLEGQSLSCVAVEPDTRLVYVGTAHGQLLTVAGIEQVCGLDCDVVG